MLSVYSELEVSSLTVSLPPLQTWRGRPWWWGSFDRSVLWSLCGLWPTRLLVSLSSRPPPQSVIFPGASTTQAWLPGVKITSHFPFITITAFQSHSLFTHTKWLYTASVHVPAPTSCSWRAAALALSVFSIHRHPPTLQYGITSVSWRISTKLPAASSHLYPSGPWLPATSLPFPSIRDTVPCQLLSGASIHTPQCSCRQ